MRKISLQAQAREDDEIILSRENKANDKTTPALFSVICKVFEYELTRGELNPHLLIFRILHESLKSLRLLGKVEGSNLA